VCVPHPILVFAACITFLHRVHRVPHVRHCGYTSMWKRYDFQDSRMSLRYSEKNSKRRLQCPSYLFFFWAPLAAQTAQQLQPGK
jgi:hypothetical protein